MAQSVLTIRNLAAAYGKVEALSGINLSVNEGQIVTVIGPNGAGKTTLLSAAMGLLPSKGDIEFDGILEAQPEVEHLVGRGLILVPEKRELFGEMSVEDNLILGAFQRHRAGHRALARDAAHHQAEPRVGVRL